MKKVILFLCLLFSFSFLLIIGWPMQTLSFSEIPAVSKEIYSELAKSKITLPFNILRFEAAANALPQSDNAWYTPALTDEVLAKLPYPLRIVRSETAENGTYDLLVYGAGFYVEYHLVETKLPVISIRLRRFGFDPKYIEAWRSPATASILCTDKNGDLQWQTDRIDIKARGDSSRVFYPKSSYTIFFLDEVGNASLRTPLGLPADRKFALNALYEDDSKIRDALSMYVSAQISPEHTMHLAYTELILNDTYYGLYGMHNIVTENTLHTDSMDTVYKINSGAFDTDMPAYEIAVGNLTNNAPLESFIQYFSSPTGLFPKNCDYESVVDYIVTMEIIANTDARLKNMVFIHRADPDLLQLFAWDMDLTFGFVWLDKPPLYFGTDSTLTNFRYTDFSPETQFEPLGILYASLPDLQNAVAARYRELRQTVFTDEVLLEQANALYNQLTDCGARQRDAERWPDSAISTDNSFIETFIPARMAFLDQEFDFSA